MRQVSLINVPGLQDHSVSNHPMHPQRRFHTLPISALDFRFCGLGFAIS